MTGLLLMQLLSYYNKVQIITIVGFDVRLFTFKISCTHLIMLFEIPIYFDIILRLKICCPYSYIQYIIWYPHRKNYDAVSIKNHIIQHMHVQIYFAVRTGIEGYVLMYYSIFCVSLIK